MKLILSALLSAISLIATTSAAPVKRNVDPALVPQFGVQSGVNPSGTGDCDGITNAAGKVIKIPCSCPPDRNAFIQSLNANVAAGRAVNNPSVAVSFPTDNSKASQVARIQAAIVTLQNLKGPGVGCPAASTTFVAQQQAIQNSNIPSVVSASPSPATSASPAATPPAPVAGGVDATLVPQFGVQPGVNPTATGDCDGITNAAGKVVKIPCSCPPDRNIFIQSLSANVAAGKAVNNPSVTVSFPTDDSKASQITRIQAAIVTLQNLKGPGIGCPAASTTFVAQQQAIQNS